MSLRLKLLLFVAIPVFGVFVAVTWIEYLQLRQTATGQAREHARLLAERTAQDLNAELAAASAAADVMAAAMSNGDLDPRRLPSIGADMVSRLALVSGAVFAFEPDARIPGIPLAGYTFVQGGDLVFEDIAASHDITADSPWYLPSLVVGEGVWTEPFIGEVFGGPIVSYTTPFRAREGARGFVVVDVPLDPMVLQLDVGDFDNVEGLLVSAEGFPIIAPAGGVDLDAASESHVIEQAYVVESGWTFIAAMPKVEVYAGAIALLLRNALMMALAGIAVLVLLLVVSLRITRRIETVAMGVQAVAAGDLDAHVSDDAHDEIGQLAKGFNHMTSRLRGTVETIARQKAHRQAVERELETAREIQESMLPREFPPFPDRREFDLHATLTATSHVAGDFYDWWVTNNTLTVLVADVSGHGMPAALVMAMSRMVLRDAASSGASLPDMLASLNSAIANDNDRQMFLTGIIVQLDLGTGGCQLVNAGHPQAIMIDGDDVRPEGMPTGPLVGVMTAPRWDVRCSQWKPGSTMVLYTDGITEARAADGDLLDTSGLVAALASGSPRDVCAQAIATAEAFQDGPLADDLTVLALRWRGPST